METRPTLSLCPLVHAACYILRNDATVQRKGNEKALDVASADKETRRNECAGEMKTIIFKT
jgi:hypothetical protein